MINFSYDANIMQKFAKLQKNSTWQKKERQPPNRFSGCLKNK
jgi:hypothetical protein